MTDENKPVHTPVLTPSDGLQHIQFEGCDYCVIAPEDYDTLLIRNRLATVCGWLSSVPATP